MTAAGLADHFDRTAEIAGGRLAIREAARDWSYAELLARSREVSVALGEAGVARGDRVALMLPNSGAFVASFFAIARAAAAVAPLNPAYREQEIRYFARDTGATALVTSSLLAPIVEGALADAPSAPAVIEIGEDGQVRPRSTRVGSRAPPAGESSADPALLHQYTSGSTGAPKRIVRTHDMLVRELEALASTFDLGPEDRFLGAAPFSHVNGLVRTMLTSMFVGGTLHPMPEFQRRRALELVTREALTYFGAVPTMFGILAETPVRGHVDLSSLRVAFSSSAPLRLEDNRLFEQKYGLLVRQLYGSTETGTISVNRGPDWSDDLPSVGRPLPGVDLVVVDESRSPVGAGEEGEVAIASPWAIGSYAGNAEATAESFGGGFYYSGDLGRLDRTGRLTLTGRLKFLINRAGYKVNPLEVEEAILSMPQVREVVVLAVPARFGDDAVRCVAVVSQPCTEQDIVEHCRGRIADYKVPSVIELRDSLPRSAAGKVLRSEL